jgi:hypothetical protein
MPGWTAAKNTSVASLIEQVTLTLASPDDIQAGDVITFRVWPAYGTTPYNSSAPLRIYGAEFQYNAKF